VYDATDDAGRHRLLARAVVKQANTSVVVSHTSAVPFHGGPTWRLPRDVVHVTRPDGRAGRAEAGVRQHQGALLPEDITIRDGLEITSPTRTAIDVTTCLGTEASVVVVSDLLHRGLTTLEDVRARYEPMSRDPFTLKTDLVLRLADGRLESVGESRAFFLCYRCGLPSPVPQFELRDENGVLVARLDLAWPEHGVWLEFDGREKYERYLRPGESVADAVLREKERESMISELTGWRCIRITWADLRSPERTAARIAAMLGVATRVPAFTS
jgi:hypothetical protein